METNAVNLPAILNTTAAAPYVSERYKFIPTQEYLDAFAAHGWTVKNAQQVRSRKSGKAEFAKHMVTLSHEKYEGESLAQRLGGLSPRVHLVNSHDHSSRFKLIVGIFRLLCSNGLMVSTGEVQAFSFLHNNSARDAVSILTDKFFADVETNVETADKWSGITLNLDQQIDFATKARNIRFGEDSTVEPTSLLDARRPADAGDDLWRVFNRLQENTTKGGIRFAGMRRSSRLLTNIDANVRVNQGLWSLAATYA